MATDLTVAAVPSGAPVWVPLGNGTAATRSRPASPSVGRVVLRFVLTNLVAVVLLIAGGLWASVGAAEDEALADARRTTDLLAAVLVQPLVSDELTRGDPAAIAAVDVALRGRLADTAVLRLKIWTADGRVVYSDEARLIGRTHPLDLTGRQTLRDGVTRAAVSDLARPENRFERSAGRLLEVYGQIDGPQGQPLLLETYSAYDEVTARRFEIWAEFAPISLVVLLTLVAVASSWAHQRGIADLRARHAEAAEAAFKAQPDRHPHRVVHYGTFIFRPLGPLAAFDPGVDAFTGNSMFLEGHRQNTANFGDVRQSSLLVRFGQLTPAFVLQVVAPLLLIFLGYGALARETERGTLRLLMLQGAGRGQVVGGKLLALGVAALLAGLRMGQMPGGYSAAAS